MLEVGATAPAFRLPAHTGEAVALDDLRGDWVVMWWYPMADTPG